MLLPHRTDHRG